MSKDEDTVAPALSQHPATCSRDPVDCTEVQIPATESDRTGSRGQAAGRSNCHSTPKVIILMATYNGERYLAEQLDSICAQTHKNWEIWVSDDGSSDSTLQILNDYQARLGENIIRIHEGPHKGFAANFLSLVCKKNLDATYYAYCDQDDIWLPNKLNQAIKWLNTVPEKTSGLYCARTKLINQHGDILGYSPLFTKMPGFRNALIQNIGGGNTMVFNNVTLNLLQEAGEQINISAHDWWTYQLVTGAGGVIFYDSNPTLDYRQHENNFIGGNVGWMARLTRISMLLKGRFKTWNNLNFNALLSVQHKLTPENNQVLMNIISARNKSCLIRMIDIKRSGIYRQTFLGNIGLMAAVLLNKF